MIKLIIVDDNAFIRDGIKMRLQNSTDIEVVGMASNGKEAILLCKELTPDVVLMDIRMPEMNGLEATRHIKTDNSNIKVLILTSFAEQQYINKAMEYGCNGFIVKDAELDDFISIIKSVYKGFDVWSSNITYKTGTLSIKENDVNQEELNSLSAKEMEILRCVTRGLKHSEIAKEIQYNEGYSRQLVSKLCEKLGLKNTRELAVWGARMGV